MPTDFAPLPDPPYHAVIFTSRMKDDTQGYETMSEKMVALAAEQPGFIGVDSARGPDGLGITVSYWTDEAALAAWKQQAQHLLAQELGKSRWYDHYTLRVARVERAYSGPQGR